MSDSNFLSKDSFELLKYFSKVNSIAPPESNNLSDDCISQLTSAGFIECSSIIPDVDTMLCEYTYTITEKGKGYLEYREREFEEIFKPFKEVSSSLKEQAEAAKKSADLSALEAAKAKENSIKAEKRSRISQILAYVSVVISALSLITSVVFEIIKLLID